MAAERLSGLTEIWRGSERVSVSDRERTLVDALMDPGWVGGMRHLAEILVSSKYSPHFDVPKVLARLNEVGNEPPTSGWVPRRSTWPDATALLDAARERRTKGVIRLDPSVKSRGRMNKRWGLWINVAITPAGQAG